MNATELIAQRVSAGEEMVRLSNIEFLRHLNRATVWRWAKAGKIPTMRIGREFFTVNSLIVEHFKSQNAGPIGLLAEARERHEKAVMSLEKRGMIRGKKPAGDKA